jgi:hypothetical protein
MHIGNQFDISVDLDVVYRWMSLGEPWDSQARMPSQHLASLVSYWLR